MQSSQGDVLSPLLAMPGGLADSWGLALRDKTGWLVLGASALLSGHPAPTTFQLKSDGTVAGRSLWKDNQVPVCVAVGAAQQCVHGLFDTGTASFQVTGPVLGQAPRVAGSKQLVAGLAVTVTQVGAASPFWTFTTGTTKSQNQVRIGPESGSFVNTGGRKAFYDFWVLYNDTTGTISLYPVSGSAITSSENDCAWTIQTEGCPTVHRTCVATNGGANRRCTGALVVKAFNKPNPQHLGPTKLGGPNSFRISPCHHSLGAGMVLGR